MLNSTSVPAREVGPAMTDFKHTQLEQHLRLLRRYSPAVVGTVILSSEGLTIAADLANDVEEDRASAKSAAMMALGQRIALELQRGDLEQIFISGDTGHVIVARINEDAALTVLCEVDARIAMVLLDIRYSVEQLHRLL